MYFPYVTFVSVVSFNDISGLSLSLYLNSLVYHRNIFGSSSEVFGQLRQCSEIFGHLRKFSEILGKCSKTFVWYSKQFWKSSEIFGRWSEIFGKSSKTPSSACLYNKKLYYIDESVLLETKPLVDSIHHFIRDPSGVFSVCHLCECRIVQ